MDVLRFRYLAGYDSGPGSWPVITVNLVDIITAKTVSTIYTSPPLNKRVA
jgi:hypothetical protein